MPDQLPCLIMCVCTGKCPGFTKMDIWDFINRVRVELPVEYGFIHPQLCEEDGDRFLADMLKAGRKLYGWSPRRSLKQSMRFSLRAVAVAARKMARKKMPIGHR